MAENPLRRGRNREVVACAISPMDWLRDALAILRAEGIISRTQIGVETEMLRDRLAAMARRDG